MVAVGMIFGTLRRIGASEQTSYIVMGILMLSLLAAMGLLWQLELAGRKCRRGQQWNESLELPFASTAKLQAVDFHLLSSGITPSQCGGGRRLCSAI